MNESTNASGNSLFGNDALLRHKYAEAVQGYARELSRNPSLEDILNFNLSLSRRGYRYEQRNEVQRVAVCGWEMSHNAAGRVQTLADLWRGIAPTEIIGATFADWGNELWQPIRDIELPCHTIHIENEASFPQQALELVLSHPFDIVHLSKPRFPNIIFGLFYKLLWDARVIIDIDDEELGAVKADTPLSLEELLTRFGGTPRWKDLGRKDWTRASVSMWNIFDGSTVSNRALQNRYGGKIIPHARDAEKFQPSAERKRRSRERFGIPQDKTVVLFFGTPRRHKGVLETARSIAALRRSDLTYVIVGDFPDLRLKAEIEAIDGADIRFIPGQPYESIPDVVAIGDACVLLQDDHELLGCYQLPAKLIDSLAMGLLVFAQPTPALMDIFKAGCIVDISLHTLTQTLDKWLVDSSEANKVREIGRNYFLKFLTAEKSREELKEFTLSKGPLPKPNILLENVSQRKVFDQVGGWKGLFAVQTAEETRLENGKSPCALQDTKVSVAVSGKDKPDSTLLNFFSEKVKDSVFFEELSKILSTDIPDSFIPRLSASEASLEKAADRIRDRSSLPLVSVIMPTFDRADIIMTAINSVVGQSYKNWELLVCDDESTDSTIDVVSEIDDKRIRILRLPKGGAAAARNAGLRAAKGDFIAYLDSDNVWHPYYISRILAAFSDHPGKSSCYADYIDYKVSLDGTVTIKSFERPEFDHERLLEKNYIDLNTFSHRRELYDLFGGFNEALTRRQDYDMIIKFTWLRDPVRIHDILALYQRNDGLDQITTKMKSDDSCVSIIKSNIERYQRNGLPCQFPSNIKKVNIISWDLCRNHFSKPFAVAEALSEIYDVKLVSFRFFEEEIFPPLKDVSPSFKTAYFQGSDFPEFFDTLRKAIDELDGDIIYVVKPRLPSLGLALLVNALRGTPIVLEINDLETVVGSPKVGDRHEEAILGPELARSGELISPYSETWSRIMDPVAKKLPVLLTHNKGLDEHFGNRCLYMRNLKNENVYDPRRYDRNAVRLDLGFTEADRIILFGGLLRKHKGIYELVELVERLDDPRYKLLFVGSRVTPDQKKLVEKFGDQIRVLPPQDREAMARINLAADLVILWLNPDVPAGHYQMPYKATDAFAMGPHIIANDISDLGVLHRQGYLTQVPFGNWSRMTKAIHDVFDRPERTKRIRAASRRLFLRQFSYAAARSSFALAANRAMSAPHGPNPAATEFASQFNTFFRNLTGESEDFITLPTEAALAGAKSIATESKNEGADAIRVLDVANLGDFRLSDPAGVAIVMPSIDVDKARSTADILLKRAGIPATILIAEDTLRQGFIPTLNDVSARLDVRYVVYLAEDAFPGLDWLKLAYDRLEETGKGLLAFNCGKWRGRIAAFGMVRMSWVRTLYGGAVLYPGYKAHKADNEITVIARATDQFIYEPDATLVEIDTRKTGANPETAATAVDDRTLFKERFRAGFDGQMDEAKIAELWDEYLNRRALSLVKKNV